MHKNRISILLGLLVFAVVSVSAQMPKALKDPKYNYAHYTAEQLGAIQLAVDATLKSLNAEELISEVTEYEVAVCMDAKDFKKFIKEANKIAKKEKLTLCLSENPAEECDVKYYAKPGKVVIISQVDKEIASVTIISGK